MNLTDRTGLVPLPPHFVNCKKISLTVHIVIGIFLSPSIACSAEHLYAGVVDRYVLGVMLHLTVISPGEPFLCFGYTVGI